MAMISQFLRFILPRSPASTTAFSELRRRVQNTGAANFQYFGYVVQHGDIPKPENQMYWWIEWPEKSAYRTSQEFKQELIGIAEDKPKSLIFKLTETKSGEALKALEANICEFAYIVLLPHAPRFDNEFKTSMHKTFTDCYFAKGFTGGGWGYALNSNEPGGPEISISNAEESLLEEKERMMPCYMIGWNSIAEHKDYEKTELFDVEIDKLKPYFGPGTGSFYVTFERHD